MKHSMKENAALGDAARGAAAAEAGPALPGPWRTVLDLARWAPSGDNTQPWRFEVRSASHAVAHCFDTRAESVYDLDGRPSRLSVGAMLETLRIAAAGCGLRARVERRTQPEASALRFDVHLAASPEAYCPELLPCIATRSVQRRPLSTRALAADARAALEASVGPEHEVVWLDSPAARRSVAGLLYRSARIRLTTEEAYRTHVRVLEWRATHSAHGIPDAAVGLDPVSLAAMRWAMASWERARFVATRLGGTIAPRVQLDLLPALLCAAHVLVLARRPPPDADADVDADLAAGAAVQRFWLTAERFDVRHQPQATPLIFSRYARSGRRFTRDLEAIETAARVGREFSAIVGADRLERTVWFGRLGYGPRARARSLRLPLEALLLS